MNTRPSVAELRARVYKHHHAETSLGAPPAPAAEIGNWLARKVGRPTAVYGTWLALRLGLSANFVTAAALIVSLASAAAIGCGTRATFIIGTLLAAFAYWLDHVDGQVARWRRTASLSGVYFDYLMHHIHALALGFALGHGLAARSGNPWWSVAGFAIALGWGLLGLHNDCRYKAFFQRLKRESATYRIRAGSGGRPEPPARWPRRGRGLITWPAYKACEPHVILVELMALAGVAVAAPAVWMSLWKAFLLGMAGLAPLLALGRIARAIQQGSVDAEFSRWFQRESSRAPH
jgi:phosphatidylglycerophosphate synthase